MPFIISKYCLSFLSHSETEEDRVIHQEEMPQNPTSHKCSPINKVLFLKTHKTGSSTVTNIINRYGNKKDLTFALPKNQISFGWPKRFSIETVVPLYDKPDLLCNHARYNRLSMHFLFPKETTAYISILRDPVAQYESVFNYMKLWEGLNIPGYLDSMEILKKYLLNVSSFSSARMDSKLASCLLRNPMFFDLGLDFVYFQDMSAVWKYIQFLESEFTLVMIMEHFDESVVLLKRLLCWELEDVVYLKQNERQDKDKRIVSEKLKQNIRSWNQADGMLYQAFNKTLWKKIAAEGPEFYEDLARFRKLQKEVFEKCVKSSALAKAYSGKYVKGYKIRDDLPPMTKKYCSDMTKNELSFMAENMERHKQKLNVYNDQGDFSYLYDHDNNWDKGKDFLHHPVQ